MSALSLCSSSIQRRELTTGQLLSAFQGSDLTPVVRELRDSSDASDRAALPSAGLSLVPVLSGQREGRGHPWPVSPGEELPGPGHELAVSGHFVVFSEGRPLCVPSSGRASPDNSRCLWERRGLKGLLFKVLIFKLVINPGLRMNFDPPPLLPEIQGERPAPGLHLPAVGRRALNRGQFTRYLASHCFSVTCKGFPATCVHSSSAAWAPLLSLLKFKTLFPFLFCPKCHLHL